MAIRIDQLAPTSAPHRDHVLPVMREGMSNRLTVAQILSLLATSDLAGKLEDAPITLPEGSTLSAETLGAAIAELEARIVAIEDSLAD